MQDSVPPSGPIPRAPSHPAPSGVRHVLAVVGGRGGAGTSTLAINLGVYLAQLGRRVLLIDASPSGAGLHTLLGLEPAQTVASEEDPDDDDLKPVPTQVPGLLLVPQSYRAGSTSPIRPGRKPRWARKLRTLEVDYVLLDLGCGTAPSTLDLFLGADQVVCVTTPEPPSVEGTYRLLRAVFLRSLRRSLVEDRFRLRLVERAESEAGAMPSPLTLVRTIARYDSSVGARRRRARPAPPAAGREQRPAAHGLRARAGQCDLAHRYLGVRLDYVGHVEQDDAVWLSVVKSRPLLIDSPSSKSARNLERIARRMLALGGPRPDQRPDDRPVLIPDDPNLYDVLWTHRGSSDEELRRAYKRQREMYQPGSLPLTSLLSADSLRAEQARIEEAHDTLLDPRTSTASSSSGIRTGRSSRRCRGAVRRASCGGSGFCAPGCGLRLRCRSVDRPNRVVLLGGGGRQAHAQAGLCRRSRMAARSSESVGRPAAGGNPGGSAAARARSRSEACAPASGWPSRRPRSARARRPKLFDQHAAQARGCPSSVVTP